MIQYHDEEWGSPLHDDRRLFEYIVLDGMQAGLGWQTVINKRENFRRAFHDFDPRRVARYTARDRARLLADAGIIRNRAKVAAAIVNAQRFLDVQEEYKRFMAYFKRAEFWHRTGFVIAIERVVSETPPSGSR